VLQAQVAERQKAVRDERQKTDATIQARGAAADNAACCATRPQRRVRRRWRWRRRWQRTDDVEELSNPGEILLVDDDHDLLKLISLRLTSAGYRVRTADSGETALAALALARPGLVITDLKMPGIDGMQLFEAIHRQHPALPVIILTAHGTIPDAVSATQRGVFGFLTPFDSQELLQKVAASLKLSGNAPVESDTAAGEWREGILTRSPKMEDLLRQARLVAESDASVLIYGDSGTGKELLARAIHRASRRALKPFVAVNCGAIPATCSSRFFGHARGVHRRRRRAQRAVPGCRWGHAAAGRDRRHAAAAAGQALTRAAGRRSAAGRRDAGDARRRPRHLGDASRSRGAARGRALPRGSVLPVERRLAQPAAAVGAAGRHPVVVGAHPAPARRAIPEARSHARPRRDGAARAAPWPETCGSCSTCEQAVALTPTTVIRRRSSRALKEDAAALVPFEEAECSNATISRGCEDHRRERDAGAQHAKRNRKEFYKLLNDIGRPAQFKEAKT
jgi:two-component system response regulator GlrR